MDKFEFPPLFTESDFLSLSTSTAQDTACTYLTDPHCSGSKVLDPIKSGSQAGEALFTKCETQRPIFSDGDDLLSTLLQNVPVTSAVSMGATQNANTCNPENTIGSRQRLSEMGVHDPNPLQPRCQAQQVGHEGMHDKPWEYLQPQVPHCELDASSLDVLNDPLNFTSLFAQPSSDAVAPQNLFSGNSQAQFSPARQQPADAFLCQPLAQSGNQPNFAGENKMDLGEFTLFSHEKATVSSHEDRLLNAAERNLLEGNDESVLASDASNCDSTRRIGALNTRSQRNDLLPCVLQAHQAHSSNMDQAGNAHSVTEDVTNIVLDMLSSPIQQPKLNGNCDSNRETPFCENNFQIALDMETFESLLTGDASGGSKVANEVPSEIGNSAILSQSGGCSQQNEHGGFNNLRCTTRERGAGVSAALLNSHFWDSNAINFDMGDLNIPRTPSAVDGVQSFSGIISPTIQTRATDSTYNCVQQQLAADVSKPTSDQIKLQRAIRNRESAKRSRMKNKLLHQRLQDTYNTLKDENDALKRIVANLVRNCTKLSPEMHCKLLGILNDKTLC